MRFLEKKCVKELAFECLYEEHSLFYKKAIEKYTLVPTKPTLWNALKYNYTNDIF